jgi:nucleotide-binding universal stress UspA family protein
VQYIVEMDDICYFVPDEKALFWHPTPLTHSVHTEAGNRGTVMFKTILVSLDGSALAEQALAPAFSVAAKYNAAIVLLRVVPPERALPGLQYLAVRPNGAAADPAQDLIDEAQDYLARVTLPMQGVPVHTRVLVGAPPELIVATAFEAAADLIVMSTHGRTGLTRLLYGSVAEAVLRGSPVPVLLVPNRIPARLIEEDQDLARLGVFTANIG